MENTHVNVGLEFRNTSSTPTDEVVVTTLAETLGHPNNIFNISIVTETLQVIQSPHQTNLTTAGTSETTNGPSSTHESTATHVPTTHGSTSTHVPITQVLTTTTHGPTITHVPTTHGPTTTYVPVTQGPTTTHVPVTQGPTTTHVPETQGPTTTQGSNTTHGDATQGPTTNHVPITQGPTTTQGATTTHVPVTQGLTTTQGPTTTYVPATQGPTTTHGPASTHIPATQGPTFRNPTTPAVPTSSPPIVVWSATVEEPFVEEFNDINSVQYKALENRIVTACDTIYRQRFGFIFIRTFIIRVFRSVVLTEMENTHVNVGLEFRNTSSTPTDEVVVATLAETLGHPNNIFNISIVTETLQVIQSPHQTNLTTAGTSETTNGPSSTHESTATHVPTTHGSTITHVPTTHGPTTTYVPVTQGPTTTHVPVTQGPTTAQGSNPTHVSVTQVSNPTQVDSTQGPTTNRVPTIQEPTTAHGQTTTHVPVTQGPTTTQVPTTQGQTTTQGPTSTHFPASQGPTVPNPTTPAVPTSLPPIVVWSATVEEPFVEEFNDINSVQYKALENRIVTACDTIYRQRFGFIFIRTFVIRVFRAVVLTQMENTHVNVGLEFRNTSSTPTDEVVVATLEETLGQPNNIFNISIVAETLQVIQSPHQTNSTTAGTSETTNGPSSTHESTATHVPTTHGSTSTHVPITQVLITTTHGPTITHVPTTHGPTTTHVPVTQGPTTAQGSNPTHVPVTQGPTTAQGPTSTHFPATQGPTVPNPTTPAVPTSLPPIVVWSATVEEPFVEEFNDINSVQYKALENRIVTACDTIYRQRFGFMFIRTFVIRVFRSVVLTQMENTHVNVGLEFRNTSSTPTDEVVVATLEETLGQPNNIFNISIVAETLQVIQSPHQIKSTTAGTSEPTNEQSSTHESTATHVPTTHGSTITHVPTTHGQTTTHVPVTQGPTTAQGSNPTHVSVAQGPTTTHVPTSGQVPTSQRPTPTHGPTSTHVPGTQGSITTHVAVTQGPMPPKGPTSTPVPATQGPTVQNPTTTAAVTTSSPPVVVLSATLEEPFVEEFNDVNSAQYRALENRVVTVCDMIYRQRFGFIFIRTFVIRVFRAVVLTRMENTRVNVGLEFANTSSTPTDEVVVATLEETLAQPNNTFNISIVADSLQVIQSPHKTNSTTTKANATAAPGTTAAKNPTTSAMSLTTRTLRFTSAGETFTSDLLNQSSAAFINRAAIIKTTLEPLYKVTFSSFKDLTATSFSNGSIINNMDLRFASDLVPSNNAIARVLINAAPNITAFNVNTSSIFVDGILVSSGASQEMSLITACGMMLLSWLLARQQ
ncbi:uncharacterized protein LOC144004225 [Festucalex cinctus]